MVAITRMGGGARAATAHFIDEYAATAIEAGRRGQLARGLARKERAARGTALASRASSRAAPPTSTRSARSWGS